MFEEVPRERRGVARWLLAHPVGLGPFVLRPLAVGPFVLGGGMLLAAIGGSVAVAAAATVLTASAIGSDDLPARPQHAVAATSPSHTAPAHSSASRPVGSSAAGLPAAGTSGAVTASRVATPAASTAAAAGTALPTRSPAGSSVPAAPVVPTGSGVPSVSAGSAGSPTGGSPVPAPSSSGPLGNALIHVSGYDQATGRLAYQFATTSPDGDGMRYVVSGPETFSAALAPTVTVVSGGTLCPPAGSTCTTDQLIAAADAGFFAEAAIDVTGTLRSVLEVNDQAVTARLAPVPSSSPTPTASGGASEPS